MEKLPKQIPPTVSDTDFDLMIMAASFIIIVLMLVFVGYN